MEVLLEALGRQVLAPVVEELLLDFGHVHGLVAEKVSGFSKILHFPELFASRLLN